ncbi:NAD(P)-dependent oxidoreductase [Brachybacterium sp. Z12]|uniref:NAD(P)-dependent oxidoreductase n=1 Tax=Brachybacterium sp. Z12 TaxID=2759167 RepID=UPI0018601D6C|nr:NAD(P)-dependent oxidoreductase [Brachybacterium sp. Z12]QNN82535.1 NAD(P)-dependent oxidoreductase [Brachybacterium sp. Z12]
MSSRPSSPIGPTGEKSSSQGDIAGVGPRPVRSVAVLGLGPMGLPIARNLLDAGFSTTVWNRTRARAEELLDDGAIVADDIAAAACDVVLSVLPDVGPLQDLLDEAALAAFAEAGTVLVVMSTTGPQQVRALGDLLSPHGIRVVDAPMSGGVAGAAAGALSLMIGGDDADVARIRPVLAPLSQVVTHLGALGAGSLAKLCNQIVVAGTLAALGEAFGLARASGIDAAQLAQVLGGGLASSEVLTQKQDKLLRRDYSLGGSTDNQVKDLVYATEAMGATEVEARLLPVLLEAYQEIVDRGDGQLDHAAVQELYATD